MAAFKQFMSFCCQCDEEIHQMRHKAFKKKTVFGEGWQSFFFVFCFFTQRAQIQRTIEAKVCFIGLVWTQPCQRSASVPNGARVLLKKQCKAVGAAHLLKGLKNKKKKGGLSESESQRRPDKWLKCSKQKRKKTTTINHKCKSRTAWKTGAAEERRAFFRRS